MTLSIKKNQLTNIFIITVQVMFKHCEPIYTLQKIKKRS